MKKTQKCKCMISFLEYFYRLTLNVSGSSYVTSNTFFHEISQVYCLLVEMINNDSSQHHAFRGREMANAMMDNFNKYQGDIGRNNILIYIAVILNPRYKFEYLEYGLDFMYKEHGISKKLASEAMHGLS